jgi:hypothetical protein
MISVLCMKHSLEDLLGVDKYGKAVAGNAHVKNRLTKGYTGTQTIKTDKDGNRVKEIFFHRCPGVTLMCTNEVTQDSNSPTMQRFIKDYQYHQKKDQILNHQKKIVIKHLIQMKI